MNLEVVQTLWTLFQVEIAELGLVFQVEIAELGLVREVFCS